MTTLEKTTVDSGNTKQNQPQLRGRAFLFTIHELEKYDELMLLLSKINTLDYYVSAKEKAPTTEKEHIHLYTHFTQPYKLNKKIMALHIHTDICRGTPQQNIKYVKKDGDIIEEYGEPPKQGGRTVKDLEEIDTPDDLPANYYNIWKNIKAEKDNDIDIEDLKKNVEVYYISGPSGIGKTEKAKEIIRNNKEKYGSKINMVKYENGFWLGVGSAKVALYDDFRDSHLKASEFINFIDYNKHLLNIKGGSKMNDYNLIIITSVQPLHELYKNMSDEPKKQWIRRINNIELNDYNIVEDIDLDDI